MTRHAYFFLSWGYLWIWTCPEWDVLKNKSNQLLDSLWWVGSFPHACYGRRTHGDLHYIPINHQMIETNHLWETQSANFKCNRCKVDPRSKYVWNRMGSCRFMSRSGNDQSVYTHSLHTLDSNACYWISMCWFGRLENFHSFKLVGGSIEFV